MLVGCVQVAVKNYGMVGSVRYRRVRPRRPTMWLIGLRACCLVGRLPVVLQAMLPCPLPIYVAATLVVALVYTPILTHVGASSRSLLDATRGGQDGSRGSSGTTEGVLLGLSVGGAVALVCTLRHLSNRYLDQMEQEEEQQQLCLQSAEEQGIPSYSSGGIIAPSPLSGGLAVPTGGRQDDDEETDLGSTATIALLPNDSMYEAGRAEQGAVRQSLSERKELARDLKSGKHDDCVGDSRASEYNIEVA